MNSEVLSTLSTGRISYGPKSSWFERLFADSHHCDFGVISNSGTSALLVALEALKHIYQWEDGDEVIVPALTFVASVNAIIQAGLTPVLVDVHPRTYNIDETSIGRHITDKTVAIMPVHMFGRPCEMNSIMRIAATNNLRVVEDCCEAFGARYNRYPVGSIGDVGCFSTYVGHHIVTGVGGMSITNDPDIAITMRSLVNHGLSTSELPTGEAYDPSMLGRVFEFDKIGHSFRSTEIEATIGVHQMRDWPKKISKRRENAKLYYDVLGDVSGIQITPNHDHKLYHSFMVFPIVITNGTPAKDAIEYLNNSRIEARLMMPLTNQPCYNFDNMEWPRAAYINEYGFYVGCHEYLTKAQIVYAAEAIKCYFTG